MTMKEWEKLSTRQRQKKGYLQNYPVKSSKIQWKTARGGNRVARVFLSDRQLEIAAQDAKKRGVALDVADPSTGEILIGPKWYKKGVMGEAPSKTLCPICHRALKNGYCMEHGDIKAQGWRWDNKRKKWISSRQKKKTPKQSKKRGKP